MKALAIRHVKIEHLGLLEPILQELGMGWEYLDTSEGQTLKGALEEYSLLIVLGGYMGAYEENKYPFLSYEYRIMEEALKKDIPLLGICLGSQMLAKVLGARVYRGDRGKEIGWMKVYKTGEHDYFRGFPEELTVFQWHGDTFDLPYGAVRVYSSERYENQAFVYKRAVGLQFHIEVDINMAQEWMQTSKEELSEDGIKINEIPSSYADRHVELLHKLLKVMLFNE